MSNLNLNKYANFGEYNADTRPSDKHCVSLITNDYVIYEDDVNHIYKIGGNQIIEKQGGLYTTPVPEVLLDNNAVALVLKDNSTGELLFADIDAVQEFDMDLSGYEVKPYVRFHRGRNGKSVVMHKDQIADAQWATNNRYKVYCDTSSAGGFTITVGNWGTSTSATVSWSAGATLDSIVAQMTNGSYCWFSHVSGENFIRVSCYCSSASYNCTLTNNTGGSVEDLSKYCRVNGVVQSEVHRVWQGTDVRTLFPDSNFVAANTIQYARNGYNLSYYCGGNLARYKAYFESNGNATYVAETTLGRMSRAGFNACNNSGNADAQALYDKYSGSWDDYMEAAMVQIDDKHKDGIEYKSYNNGDTQTRLLASVTTMDFDGSWIPAYPSAYATDQFSDAELGAFNMPTEHELAVFMEDDKFEKINAAITAIGGGTLLSITAYYWSVARYGGRSAWFYYGGNGRLSADGLYYGFQSRALAYLN